MRTAEMHSLDFGNSANRSIALRKLGARQVRGLLAHCRGLMPNNLSSEHIRDAGGL
jgi:hypothetical protein